MSAGPIPAHDLDAEAAVIAAVLLSPEAIDDVREIMSAEDCYSDANRRILDAALELDAEGTPVDVVTVMARLRDRDRLAQVGGAPYLSQLVDATPAIANVGEHARIVRDKARTRRMVAVCQAAAAQGYGDVGDVDEWLQGVERSVFGAAERVTADGPEMLSELVPKALTEMSAARRGDGPQRGVRTGLSALDQKIGSLRYGVEYVIAGRPGMGKTALAACLAVNIPQVNTDTCTVFVSAEMPKPQMVARLIAARARVDLSRIERAQDLTDDNWQAIALASEELARVPMSIQFAPGATLTDIRSIVRREVRRMCDKAGRKLKLAAVFVDYLQILNGQRERGASREQEIADLSKRLLWMAGEFDCAMVTLSQLNRGVESRPDKRPNLSDLRESGAIEQDAFAVLFAYRDEYYDPKSADAGTIEIGIAKHRQGPTGKAFCRFAGSYTAVEDLDAEQYRTYSDLAGDCFDNE